MLPLDQETLPADCIYVVAGIANFHQLMQQLGDGETRLFMARLLRRAEGVARHLNGQVVAQAPDHVVIQTGSHESASHIAALVREKLAQLWVPQEAQVDYFTRIDHRLTTPQRASPHARITYQSRIFVLDGTTPLFTVGRLPSACLSIDSERVSRRHATLELQNGNVTLHDTSTNGTFIHYEGETQAIRVHQRKHLIRRNATLTFGASAEKPGTIRITLEILSAAKTD